MEAEHSWILQAQAGDRQAYGQLVRLHQARLRAWAVRLGASPEDALDVVQDAFVDALADLEDFDATRDFGAWMRGMVRHRVLKLFRARQVRQRHRQRLVSAQLAERAAAWSDSEATESEARVADLHCCLERLPPRQRELLQRRYGAGESVGDLGQWLGRSAGAIHMALSRVRAQLRRCLQERGHVR